MNNSYITSELTKIMEEYNKFEKDNIVPFIKKISETINDFLMNNDYRSYKIYICNTYDNLKEIAYSNKIKLISRFFDFYIQYLYRHSTNYYIFVRNNDFSSEVKKNIGKMNSFVKSLS